jgi:mono/diheme cytochrome c family protein
MPAFGKKLSRQEIVALVSYVRRFNKPTQRPQD